MALLSTCGVGVGASDVFFGAFLLDVLRLFGASKFKAFSAVAVGSVASIVAAPLVGAYGRKSVFHRKWATIACFSVGASASLCIGYFGRRRLWYDEDALGAWSVQRAPQGKGSTKVALIFVFAAVYRAFTQASPAVAMCIDAASSRTKGTEESSLARVKIGVSWWYLWTRVGTLAAFLVLALMSERSVENLLLPYGIATFIFFITIVLTAIFMPTTNLDGMAMQMHDAPGQTVGADIEEPEIAGPAALSCVSMQDPFDGSAPQEPLPPHPSPTPPFLSDVKAVTLRAPRPLKFLFLQTFLFGIMNGLLRIIVAPYFNEIQQVYSPMDSSGVSWMAYSGLLSWTVGITHDAVIGSFAIASNFRAIGGSIFWVGELFFGSALFVALFFIRTQILAFVAFSAIAIAVSSQSFFNLIAASALPPEPHLGSLTFGIRAACLHTGELIGSLVAAFLERKNESGGFRSIMLLCAAAVGTAALAAIGVGTWEVPKFSDLPVNANPLLAFLRNRDDEEVFVKRITEKAE